MSALRKLLNFIELLALTALIVSTGIMLLPRSIIAGSIFFILAALTFCTIIFAVTTKKIDLAPPFGSTTIDVGFLIVLPLLYSDLQSEMTLFFYSQLLLVISDLCVNILDIIRPRKENHQHETSNILLVMAEWILLIAFCLVIAYKFWASNLWIGIIALGVSLAIAAYLFKTTRQKLEQSSPIGEILIDSIILATITLALFYENGDRTLLLIGAMIVAIDLVRCILPGLHKHEFSQSLPETT